MGRPKLLLPWGATTVLGQLIEQWHSLGASQIAVVMAPQDTALETERMRVEAPTNAVVNPSPERGMFSSIQCAAQWPGWQPEIAHWALALGDQPHVRTTTLSQLLAALGAQPNVVWQPAHNGRARHPVMFPREVFLKLGASDAPDLKTFLSSLDRRTVEIDDPGLDLDIDTPEDFEAARRLADFA
jgi:molybdenum cofactor cytidylyltransferase